MDDLQENIELENRVDKLTKEAVLLRKEVVFMKAAIKQQNVMIKELMKRPKPSKKVLEFADMLRFPIASQVELDDFERSINAENAEAVIDEIRCIIKLKGLERSMSAILSESICIAYNLDGVQNKKRLSDYKALMNILYKAAYEPDMTREDFHELIRQGLRRAKGCFFKRACHERKRQEQRAKQEQSKKSARTESEEPATRSKKVKMEQ